ncbi:phosphogluconate dehydrogenase (NADP(+)-dependent, decarboxylating) [bacterium]|nr:phosphogluconate dehydrogenase (NADP(+)-dependent, decarboxylating) [bacterium]|tara:strand:+ start:5623 stop:7035 length:1413 start_codon:yes stop_codon:yes gene_type:complete
MSINQLGVIGLGTMGANLARNAARNGAKVAVFNRTTEVMHDFVKEYGKEGMFVPCKTYEELVRSLDTPRAILLMVKAGSAVDAVLEDLLPHLSEGDIIIDGGNSHYPDTERRYAVLKERGIRFLGMGVSGGEEGALMGPSMMPGGDKSAWDDMKDLLEKMAADDGLGGKCVSYIGEGGSGHFVKMVHNGIEYGVMQLIAESYDIMKNLGGYSNKDLAETFAHWNEGDDLNSFLVEITAKIFTKADDQGGGELIDKIKDAAGQKGTGKWTTEAAMDLGVAIPTINAAVDARILSGDLKKREARSEDQFPVELDEHRPDIKPHRLRTQVRSALECSIICTHNQGFQLIEWGSDEYGWNINLAEVARIWRGGCIIRSKLLGKFQRACDPGTQAPEKEILDRFSGERQTDWRHVVRVASVNGIPIPAIGISLSYYDTIRRERLPQNLIQAQRDLFGAHTFERTDKAGTFHADWE